MATLMLLLHIAPLLSTSFSLMFYLGPTLLPHSLPSPNHLSTKRCYPTRLLHPFLRSGWFHHSRPLCYRCAHCWCHPSFRNNRIRRKCCLEMVLGWINLHDCSFCVGGLDSARYQQLEERRSEKDIVWIICVGG
jgi:hypothetical protein